MDGIDFTLMKRTDRTTSIFFCGVLVVSYWREES